MLVEAYLCRFLPPLHNLLIAYALERPETSDNLIYYAPVMPNRYAAHSMPWRMPWHA